MDRVWLLLCAMLVLGGIRYLWRLHVVRRAENRSAVDDDAIRQILETGRLTRGPRRPVDMKRAAEAEDEFWAEGWDEPEEFRR